MHRIIRPSRRRASQRCAALLSLAALALALAGCSKRDARPPRTSAGAGHESTRAAHESADSFEPPSSTARTPPPGEPADEASAHGADPREPDTSPDSEGTTDGLTVVTWNVLADMSHADARLPALFEILDGTDADLIALQETTRATAARVRAADWAAGYRFARPDPEGPVQPGGLALLTRRPIEEAGYWALPSEQRRGVLVADIVLPGPSDDTRRILRVATVHLDSFLESGPLRAKQLTRVFELLDEGGDGALGGISGPADDAILLGDFNFGDGEQPDTGALDDRFVDAWRHVYPDLAEHPGLTWDIERSAMARVGSFPGESSRRLDRVLVSSERFTPVAARLLGRDPVAETPGLPSGAATADAGAELFPSDHFGVAVTLQRDAGVESSPE